MNNMISLGWQLMGYGLVGVFTTLVLFIVVIKVLMKIFPSDDEGAEQIDR